MRQATNHGLVTRLRLVNEIYQRRARLAIAACSPIMLAISHVHFTVAHLDVFFLNLILKWSRLAEVSRPECENP